MCPSAECLAKESVFLSQERLLFDRPSAPVYGNFTTNYGGTEIAGHGAVGIRMLQTVRGKTRGLGVECYGGKGGQN